MEAVIEYHRLIPPYRFTNTYFGPQDPRLKQLAIEIERKFLLGETMNTTRYIAVFNINPQGALVARLVPVTSSDLSLDGSRITESARKKKIRMVQDKLPTRHTVVGVSNLLPSSSGAGGAYIFPVRITPPAPPEPQIDIGPHARTIEDLTTDPNTYWKPEGGGYYS